MNVPSISGAETKPIPSNRWQSRQGSDLAKRTRQFESPDDARGTQAVSLVAPVVLEVAASALGTLS